MHFDGVKLITYNTRDGSKSPLFFLHYLSTSKTTLGGIIKSEMSLTAVFFETGAMPVPTKWRNPTICVSGDPFHP